jgi:N-acetylglutamate synthase-like GNAT family acetyltransferase
MGSAHQIRESTGEDAPLLARLVREAFRDAADSFGITADNCPTHPSNCEPEWIESDFAKGRRYFILESAGEPCGCVALRRGAADRCHLARLAVLPAHRRQGFGGALVQRVLAEARLAGERLVELGVISDHAELRQWYERRGFRVAESKRFDHLPFEVTFMTLRL